MGTDGINSCYISGMNLDEICCVLDTPSELLLTYNEFNNFCCLKKDVFLRFIQNRRDYYDIVCSDINTNFISKQVTIHDADDLLKFVDVCTPNPILWLPSISKSFCIYSHDESLYSYLCFKMKPYDFVNRFLNWLISSLTNEAEQHFNQTDFDIFFKAIMQGIYIDTEVTKITNDTLSISVSYFNSQADFSENLFSKEIPKFEYVHLKTGDGSMSSGSDD